MRKMKKARSILLLAAMGGIPLVTAAECNSPNGMFSFYRNDDDHDDGYYVEDGYYGGYYEDVIAYGDCFYYDCY